MWDRSRHTKKEKVKNDSTLRSEFSNRKDAVAVENF
jgi:hypothetical protein